jgi:hypothetical protein
MFDNSETGRAGEESWNQYIYFRFLAGRPPPTFFDGLKPTYFPSGLGYFSRMKLTIKKFIYNILKYFILRRKE